MRLAALAGEVMAFATDTMLHVFTGPPGQPRAHREWPLPWTPDALALSPSGTFALVVSTGADRGRVIDLRTGATLLDIASAGRRSGSIAAAFAATPAGELLVISRERFVLEALTLPIGKALFRVACHAPQPFVFDSLHPMLDDDTIIAIGHGESESKDSMATISLRALAADTDWFTHELVRRRRPWDYAYRVASGPLGHDGLIAFRDPEDDELPDEHVPPSGRDVEGFRGFYSRRLADGALVERIDVDAPIGSGAPLFATQDTIVAGATGRVLLVARGGDRQTTTLDAPVYAFDERGGRILTVSDGELTLHHLAERGVDA
ncbi:MAG TPA: hypothetical protein VFI52_02940 [Gemmatimonadaceae bacterium]|nr:hypothetical protein [Gemmatimonadaceae bacterium]